VAPMMGNLVAVFGLRPETRKKKEAKAKRIMR
jgi:hypothetical protein